MGRVTSFSTICNQPEGAAASLVRWKGTPLLIGRHLIASRLLSTRPLTSMPYRIIVGNDPRHCPHLPEEKPAGRTGNHAHGGVYVTGFNSSSRFFLRPLLQPMLWTAVSRCTPTGKETVSLLLCWAPGLPVLLLIVTLLITKIMCEFDN